MKNASGPRASIRRLYAYVINSVLCGVTVWCRALEVGIDRRQPESVQRRLALQIASAYSSVSTEAVLVVIGVPPIEQLARARQKTVTGLIKENANQEMLDEWQDRWSDSSKDQ
ncbi:uncharacterized protein LOC142319962 [Lycorma delicatula]|uniref:uncharacterized protein LOC142319962 n=1 Tax=Lycorma delicatula TaxID=130591 RepID=UPI003F511668